MEDNTEKGKFIIKIDCREHDLIPLIKSKFEDSKTIEIETGSLPVGDILFLKDEKEIPILGLFKERTEGAGHSFGLTAVRGFIDLTEEEISFSNKSQKNDNQENMRLLTLNNMGNALGITEKDFKKDKFSSQYVLIPPILHHA